MKERMKTLPKAVKILAAPVFWIGVWWILALIIGKEVVLPSPPVVFRRLLSLLSTGDFYRTVGMSVLRITIGFLSALLLGVLAGILSSRFRLFDALLTPLLSVIRATPVASFIILVLVFLHKQVIPAVISFLMVFPVVTLNIRTGILETDRGLLEMAKVFRLRKMQVLRAIRIPAVYPYFLTAFRSSLGLSWKAGVAAEVLCNPKYSIGRMLYESKVYLETPDLFAWTLTVIVISVILEKLALVLIDRKKSGRAAV